MRIQTQRDAFALRLASEFPWRVPPGAYDDGKTFEAPLENGHTLHVTGFGTPPQSWGAHYTDGIHDEKDPDYVKDWHAVPNPDHHPTPGNHFWPTREEAMAAAERGYQHAYPIGTNTGPHDSGVDYSDLNSFRDFL